MFDFHHGEAINPCFGLISGHFTDQVRSRIGGAAAGVGVTGQQEGLELLKPLLRPSIILTQDDAGGWCLVGAGASVPAHTST